MIEWLTPRFFRVMSTFLQQLHLLLHVAFPISSPSNSKPFYNGIFYAHLSFYFSKDGQTNKPIKNYVSLGFSGITCCVSSLENFKKDKNSDQKLLFFLLELVNLKKVERKQNSVLRRIFLISHAKHNLEYIYFINKE